MLNLSIYNSAYNCKIKTCTPSFKSSSALEANKQLAEEVKNEVRNMNLKSTTRKFDWQKDYLTSDEFKQAARDINYIHFHSRNKSINDYIDYTKEMCDYMKVGNCAEHAIITAKNLKDKNYKNFAIIASFFDVKNKRGFLENPIKNCFDYEQHVFVVLGLDKKADLSKPETWGENAVICDAWAGIAEPAQKGLEKIKNTFSSDMICMNYAPFIDPTKDTSSPYNWENHREIV